MWIWAIECVLCSARLVSCCFLVCSFAFVFLQMPINSSRLTLTHSRQQFAVGHFQWQKRDPMQVLDLPQVTFSRWMAGSVDGEGGRGICVCVCVCGGWLCLIIYAGQMNDRSVLIFIACYICIFVIMAATLQQADSNGMGGGGNSSSLFSTVLTTSPSHRPPTISEWWADRLCSSRQHFMS